MEFLPPLADVQDYPESTISARPSIIPKHLTSTVMPPVPQHSRRLGMFNRARTSLYVIAKSLPQTTVWLPSYHCPALVEPFIDPGKIIRFYPISRRLNADLKFLAEHVDTGDVLLGIRYFGFDCGIKELADFCKKFNLLFIEDLAHAAFSRTLYGDLAVTSLIKLYPTESGSDLLYHTERQDIVKLKIAARFLPGRLEFTANRIKKVILHFLFRTTPDTKPKTNMHRGISKKTQLIIQSCIPEEIIKKRINNYNHLCSKLTKSPLGHVLLPDLPAGTTPYVLPFLLHKKSSFDHIRNAKIQIYRWEEMVDSGCDTCEEFRSRLIQLPCHQDLSSEDLQKIVDTMTEDTQ